VAGPDAAPYIPRMNVFLILLTAAVLLGVLGVLVIGVIGMFTGNSPARSNKLMQYRVALQFIAVLLIALIALIGRS